MRSAILFAAVALVSAVFASNHSEGATVTKTYTRNSLVATETFIESSGTHSAGVAGCTALFKNSTHTAHGRGHKTTLNSPEATPTTWICSDVNSLASTVALNTTLSPTTLAGTIATAITTASRTSGAAQETQLGNLSASSTNGALQTQAANAAANLQGMSGALGAGVLGIVALCL